MQMGNSISYSHPKWDLWMAAVLLCVAENEGSELIDTRRIPGGGAGSCGRGFHRRHRGSYAPGISLLICDEVINGFRFGLSVIRIVWKYNVKSSGLILHLM